MVEYTIRKKYSVVVTAYPSEVNKGSCPEKYQTITVGDDNMDYQAVPNKPPRKFGVRYNPEKNKFVMCEYTDLSDREREKAYCFGSQDCRRRKGPEYCRKKRRRCKDELLVACNDADEKGYVSTNQKCLSLATYKELSTELLGASLVSFSNPAAGAELS